MEHSEIKRLAETIEAGLRDGRKLDSLRRAMGESGYSEETIREVIKNVDRKRTIRRPQRKKEYNKAWIASAVLILVVVGLISYILLVQPVPHSEGKGDIEIFEGNESTPSEGLRTCYVVNESVKQIMIDAGAKCDKWYLIKEI